MKKIPKLFKKLTALTMAICMSVMGTSVVGEKPDTAKAYVPTQESEIAKAKLSYKYAARQNGYSITLKYKITIGDDIVTVVPTIDKKKYTRKNKKNKLACSRIEYAAFLLNKRYGYIVEMGEQADRFFELEKSKERTEKPPVFDNNRERLTDRTLITTGCAVSAIGKTEDESMIVHIKPSYDNLHCIPYLLMTTKGDKNTLYIKSNFTGSIITPHGVQMKYTLKKDGKTIKKGDKYLQEIYIYGRKEGKPSVEQKLSKGTYTLQVKYTYKASKKFLADKIKAIKERYPK